MDSEINPSRFYRAFMTCVFAGLIGTLLCMFYNLFFTQILHFPLSTAVNVSTLIFVVNITFLVVGFLYNGFLSMKKNGESLFRVFFLLVGAFLIWRLQGVHRVADPAVNTMFKYEISGIIIILSLLAIVGVPFMYHNRRFEEAII
jgi:hypothetical protein